jgi:NAD(P)-dependent dehydrogenase (short-subunit alcohol dehydrogenase family)
MNVVVIGADKGLGEKLCRTLIEKGHQTGIGLFKEDRTGIFWESVKPEGAIFLHTDVRDSGTLDRAAEKLALSWGKLDVVVNVAGVLLPGDRKHDLLDGNDDEFIEHFKVNAMGVVAVLKSFYSLLKKGSRPFYLAVTSEGGSFCIDGAGFPQYSVTKTAANKTVQSLAATRPEIRIVALHPGRMDTEMGHTTAQIKPEESAEGIYRILTGEMDIYNAQGWFFDYLGRPMPLSNN